MSAEKSLGYFNENMFLDVTFSNIDEVTQCSPVSPPTRDFWWLFITTNSLLRLKQTKSRQHGEFITARIIPEALAPPRLPIMSAAMISFFCCSHQDKNWLHPFTPHSDEHELTSFETWQSPPQFYWIGNKITLLNFSPLLELHQETCLRSCLCVSAWIHGCT